MQVRLMRPPPLWTDITCPWSANRGRRARPATPGRASESMQNGSGRQTPAPLAPPPAIVSISRKKSCRGEGWVHEGGGGPGGEVE